MIKFFSSLFRDAEPITEAWQAWLEAEGILYQNNEVPTAITYSNYRRPGKWSAWSRRLGYVTAILVTQARFIVFHNGRKLVDLPFASTTWSEVALSCLDQHSLKLVANVDRFANQHKGEVELWFDVSTSEPLFELIMRQCDAGRLHGSNASVC